MAGTASVTEGECIFQAKEYIKRTVGMTKNIPVSNNARAHDPARFSLANTHTQRISKYLPYSHTADHKKKIHAPRIGLPCSGWRRLMTAGFLRNIYQPQSEVQNCIGWRFRSTIIVGIVVDKVKIGNTQKLNIEPLSLGILVSKN